MLIGIDASRIKSTHRTGTENYSYNLIKHLAKIDSKNKYRLYVQNDYDSSLDNLPNNFEIKVINYKKYWTQIGLSLEMLRQKPDVLFIPAHTIPFFAPKKTFLTIHDLAWKYYPEAYSKKDLFIQNANLKRAVKKNTGIVIYSRSTLSDLKKFYNIKNENIHFVSMGYEKIISISDDKKYQEYKPYILSVGRLETRKNIIGIIKAYNLLRKERKIRHKLLLAGKPGYGYDEIKTEITKSKYYPKDIVELGYVSDDDLPAIYKNASMLLYPSLCEGFGFPILEAHTFEIPVITSNRSSMAEIADGSALLVNPDKVFEIAAAMSQIINKPEIKKALNIKAKKVLSRYSWEQCAKETLAVFEEKK